MSDLPPPPEKLIVIDAAVSGQSLPIPLNRSENRSDAPTHQPDGASQGSAPPVIWRWWLARAGALLGSFPSRVFLLAAACYLLLTGVHVVFLSQPMPSGFVGWASAFTSAWKSSDSYFFLHIARYGYTDQGLGAFFPLYPGLVRLVAPITGQHFTLAGLLVAWLCCWGSYLWFYRLAAREYNERVAKLALLFLVCCPVGFFAFAPYSESVFLLVSIGAVERARAGRLWQASALAALGMLSRPTGILLLIPLGWEWGRRSPTLLRFTVRLKIWFARQSGDASQARAPQEKQAQPLSVLALLSLGLIPLALLGYMLYLKIAVGNPLAFIAGENAWARHLTWPWDTVGLFVTAFQRAGQAGAPELYAINMLDLLLVLPLPALVLYYTLRRRLLWPGAALYHLALTALLVAVPTYPRQIPYEVLLSTERFMLPAFPIFLLMGHLGAARPRLYRVLLAISVLLVLFNTLRFLDGVFVA
jgi:hypothetical protein